MRRTTWIARGPLPAATYTTFAAMARYAADRAARSADRNAPQAWAYWADIAQWADAAAHNGADAKLAAVQAGNERRAADGRWAGSERAMFHARASHVARMRRNCGDRPVRQPSLDWLKKEVKG